MPNHTSQSPIFSSPFFARFWRIAGAVSVRTKILGIVLALVLLLGVGITVQVRVVMQRALESWMEEQSVSVARDLAARATDFILVNDLFALHQLLDETQRNHPNVRYAFIADEEGHVLVHTFGDGFPEGLLTANSATAAEHHRLIRLETTEGGVWDTAVPIFEGRAGTARVGLSEAGVQAALATLTGQMLLTTVIVSAIGIAAATLLTWIVTRPILDLKRAATAVGRGDFSQHLIPWSGDEIGELAETFNVMTAELAQAEQERVERDQLRSQLLEKVITAQEDERRRIARELHDETGQSLTSLMVRLQMVNQRLDNQQCLLPDVQEQLDAARALVAQTLDGVHNLAVELRPSVLDDLGLVAALHRYVKDYQARYPVEVDLVVVGLEERLPPAVETAVYRIVQESLTNIARHSQAQTVSILIEYRHGRVRAIIEDDGVGFDWAQVKENGRLGLYGIRERAELLNGTLTIESAPGQGTSIFVEVPL
ncbi:MAG: HAMP domain-containing protein [Chloroflexi bacterium]|nr:HAMP domain-containing protein [Chloroflexota bacterium]